MATGYIFDPSTGKFVPAPAGYSGVTTAEAPPASDAQGQSASGAQGASIAQGANASGLGTYTVQPYNIDVGAITQSPQLDQIYSALTGVANGLQNNGFNYAAPQAQQAPQIGGTFAGNTQISTASDAAWQAQQQELATRLGNTASGFGVSPADLQLQQGSQANLAAQLSALGSQRGGGNPQLAAYTAANQAAAAGANLNQQMGVQRAQETLSAQNSLGTLLSQARGQAQNYNVAQAGLTQQNAQFNAGQGQGATLANQNVDQGTLLANLAQAGAAASNNQAASLAGQQNYYNDLLAMLGAGTNIAQSDRAAQLAAQTLGVQQNTALSQIAEQAYTSGSSSNSNFLNSLLSAVGASGTAAINAISHSGGSSGGGDSGGDTNSYSLMTPQPGQDPNQWYSTITSDENLKTGIQGANPMLESYLSAMRAEDPSKAFSDQDHAAADKPIADTNSGLSFHNATYGTAGSGGSGGMGAKVGGTVGAVAGAALGSFIPIVGTAIGGAAGGFLGSLFGGMADSGGSSKIVQTSAPGPIQSIGVSDDDQLVSPMTSDQRLKTGIRGAGDDLAALFRRGFFGGMS